MESLPYCPIHTWRSQALNLGSQIPKPGPLHTPLCPVWGGGGGQLPREGLRCGSAA